MDTVKVLFVCLGNICRSPAAETIFQDKINKRGIAHRYKIDSAGLINAHAGNKADPRMRKHASQRGYDITHRARQFNPEIDFDAFDYIIGMDDSNIAALKSMTESKRKLAKISKMSDYCTIFKETEIPDPYYGGSEGFEYVLDLLEDACDSLLMKLEEV
mgnify:FL=1